MYTVTIMDKSDSSNICVMQAQFDHELDARLYADSAKYNSQGENVTINISIKERAEK